ncbi:MAG: hypothetical protein P1U47_07825 [Zhongshania sp.]|uniref:hypothetical protein n=1 Tax=Zhongshania sp. TaxID=1971902 RepID=UPI00260637D1|nr:hypothetical protein [Zhongshania sp.]MDF1692265.1 hypothetical protein [Zhongshania sp.]
MKSSSITLDRILHRILMEEDVGAFTIMELRDRYLKLVNSKDVSLPKLRVYIYSQVLRLVRCGWASYHSEKKTRGQRFEMNVKPENLTVKLLPPGRNMEECTNWRLEKKAILEAPSQSLKAGSSKNPHASDKLRQMLKETQLDFMTSYGETERYALMIEEIPGLQVTLEPDLVAARNKSSRLLGHVNALELALQKIGTLQ